MPLRVSEKLVKNFLSASSLNLILIENSRYVVHNVVHNCVQCKQVQMAFYCIDLLVAAYCQSIEWPVMFGVHFF